MGALEYLDDDRQERGRNPFFSGRAKELDLFSRVLDKTASGRTVGKTLLYQGPPGVGKTGLLRECEHLAKERSGKGDAVFVPVVMAPQAFEDISVFMDKVEEKVDEVWEPRQPWRADGRSRIRQGLDGARKAGRWLWRLLKKIPHRGEIEIPGVGRARTAEARRTEALGVLQQRKSAWKNAVVVVLVDESQNIKTRKTKGMAPGDCLAAETIAHHFHVSEKSERILLVFFGLDGTHETLAGLGIPRLTGGHSNNMHSLREAEVEGSMDLFLRIVEKERGFKANADEARKWSDEITQAVQGWPQHLIWYLKAARDVLDRTNGSFSDDNLHAVLREGAYLRKVRDYDKRIQSLGDLVPVAEALAAAEEAGCGFLTLEEENEVVRQALRAMHAGGRRELDDAGECQRTLRYEGLRTPVLLDGEPIGHKIDIPGFGAYLRGRRQRIARAKGEGAAEEYAEPLIYHSGMGAAERHLAANG